MSSSINESAKTKNVTNRATWIHINDSPGPIYNPTHRTKTNHRVNHFSGKFNLAEPATFIDQIQRRARDIPGPITIQSTEIQKHDYFVPKPTNGKDIIDMRFRMKEATKPGSLPALIRDFEAKYDTLSNRSDKREKTKAKQQRQKKLLEVKKSKINKKTTEQNLSPKVKINSLEETFSIAQEQLEIFLPWKQEYDRNGRVKTKTIAKSRWRLHGPYTKSVTTLNHYNGKY